MAFYSNGQQVAAGTHMHEARWSPCHIHSKILAMSEKMHMAFLVLPPLSLFSWQQFILASSRLSSLCNDMALKHTNLGLQLASSQHCQQSQLLLGEGGGGGSAASTGGAPANQQWLGTPKEAHAYSPSVAPRRSRTGASCIGIGIAGSSL